MVVIVGASNDRVSLRKAKLGFGGFVVVCGGAGGGDVNDGGGGADDGGNSW